MPRGIKYYAVARGRRCGIFQSWEDCRPLVDGFRGARYKGFATESAAREFIAANGELRILPVSSLDRYDTNCNETVAGKGGGGCGERDAATFSSQQKRQRSPLVSTTISPNPSQAESFIPFVEPMRHTSVLQPQVWMRGENFYAVARGRQCGVFDSWEACCEVVEGFPGAIFKKFDTPSKAEAFVAQHHLPEASNSASVRCEDAKRRVSMELKEVKETVGCVAIARAPQIQHPSPLISDAGWLKSREDEATVVYVDGACRSNGRKALARGGFGGFYGDDDQRNFSLPLKEEEAQTNNRAELNAVAHVLRTTVLDCQHHNGLCIYSDSKYVLDGMAGHIYRWEASDYKLANNKPVLHRDLWSEMYILREKYIERYAKRLASSFNLSSTDARDVAKRYAVRLVHVPGHKGIRGNEMADRLAVKGSQSSSKSSPDENFNDELWGDVGDFI